MLLLAHGQANIWPFLTLSLLGDNSFLFSSVALSLWEIRGSVRLFLQTMIIGDLFWSKFSRKISHLSVKPILVRLNIQPFVHFLVKNPCSSDQTLLQIVAHYTVRMD